MGGAGKLFQYDPIIAALEETEWPKTSQIGSCVPDATTLCLMENDRFKVEIDWSTGPSGGPGQILSSGANSGLFYFFDPDNWEILVSVLNGCQFNDHFWVFAAGATDLGWELTVEDTVTGENRVWDNPLGAPAAAITDTQAFATCP